MSTANLEDQLRAELLVAKRNVSVGASAHLGGFGRLAQGYEYSKD